MSEDPNSSPTILKDEELDSSNPRAVSDDLGNTATNIATERSSDGSDDDELFDELTQGLGSQGEDPLAGIKFEELSVEEVEALADRLLASDNGYAVVDRLKTFVDVGLNPAEFVDKAMSSNQAYLVVEALDDLMDLGVAVDVRSLVDSVIKSEDFYNLTENLESLQRAGVDIKELVDRIDESSEGYPLVHNLEKFASAGISPTYLADKLISSGHVGPLVMYLPEFINAGATIDTNHLLDLLIEGEDSYSISSQVKNLLIGGAEPTKLMNVLVSSGNMFALSSNIDSFIETGKISANQLAKGLMSDYGGSYHFSQALDALTKAGLDLEELANELIQEGHAVKLVDVIKAFSGVKIDANRIAQELVNSGNAIALGRHLEDLFLAHADPALLLSMLLEAGEEFEATQNTNRFLKAGVDAKYLVDKLADTKYGPMKLTENIHDLVKAGLDPKYLIDKLEDVDAGNHVGYKVLDFLREGVSLGDILDVVSKPENMHSASALVSNLKEVLKLSSEFTIEELTERLMQMGQESNFTTTLQNIIELYPDPSFLLEQILSHRRAGLKEGSYQTFINAGVQVPLILDKIMKNGLAQSIPHNIGVFVSGGVTLKDIVEKLISHEGGSRIILSNLGSFLDKSYGLDPTFLYESILHSRAAGGDNIFEFLADSLQVFLNAGATIDANDLILRMSGPNALNYIVPNLQAFLNAGATIDVNKVFNDLIKDVRSNLAIRYLQTFLDAGATIDVNKVFNDICKSGNARNRIGGSWPAFLNNGVNPLEIRIVLGQDNLREKYTERLDEALFEDPLVKKFISTFSTSGEYLSAQLLNDVYKPVSGGANPRDIPFVKALGLELPDGISPKEAYIACSSRLREITAGVLSGSLDKSLHGIFESEMDTPESQKIINILIERLRLKRGEWSMDIDPDGFAEMVRADFDAGRNGWLRSSIETIEVDLLNERVMESITFNVTVASEEEARLLVEALNNADAAKGSPEEFMKFISTSIDLVLAELNEKKDLIISNKKIPADKKTEQVKAIELLIEKLTNEEGGAVEATLVNIGEIIQVVSNVKLKSKEDQLVLRQNLVSFLSLPILNDAALNVPDGVRQLMETIRLEGQKGQGAQQEYEAYSFTESDLKSLNEFIGHVLGKEFWTKIVSVKGKEVTRAMSRVLSAPSISDNLKVWEKAKKSLQNGTGEAEKRPIKVLTTNSVLARSTAGAMGDACYSRVGSVVPESADTCVLLGEDDEILGSFLVLKGEDDLGQAIHMIRALNPLESTLKKVSVSSITKEVFDLVSRSAQKVGATATIVIDDASNQATTNRPSILTEVSKKKGPGSKVSTHDESLIFNGYWDTPSKVYRI